ncbi:hypothetical protein [Desulfosarcina cetonica]|uniref:hypothetical protein n=1 Tax=Desulfosarcina cetonica TaxID=90730 RepID=UPI000A96E74F|nr:hypothetical protein [Desulfosarcina cetonica]
MSLRFVIVAGPPSSGKTSVMLHAIAHLKKDRIAVAVCKIDCLETADDRRYRQLDIPVAIGLSDYLCPDHFYAVNLEEVWDWAIDQAPRWWWWKPPGSVTGVPRPWTAA